MQVKQHMTKLIKFSSKYPSWKNLEGSITATKILKSFRTNRVRKRKNRFKIEKFVVLAEYFEQQTDCSCISEEKLANHGEVLQGGIMLIYLSL